MYFSKITYPAFSHHLFTLPPAYSPVYHSTVLLFCQHSTEQTQVSTANTYCFCVFMPSIRPTVSCRLSLMKDAYQPIWSNWVHAGPRHCLSCWGRSPFSACRVLCRTLHGSVFRSWVSMCTAVRTLVCTPERFRATFYWSLIDLFELIHAPY